jgi:apolipoprotein N-acyltransferase
VSALAIVVVAIWGLFGIYWVGAETRTSGTMSGRGARFAVILAVGLLAAFGRVPASAIHSPVLQVLGLAALLSGLGVAVWARVCLGRSWGMPTAQESGG